MNHVTHKCLGKNSKSFYLRVEEERSPSRVPWKVFLLMGGRTNQVTHKCLGQNSMSSYLWVDGPTKSPTSALVKILSLPTYLWKDEPSHSRVPWTKF